MKADIRLLFAELRSGKIDFREFCKKEAELLLTHMRCPEYLYEVPLFGVGECLSRMDEIQAQDVITQDDMDKWNRYSLKSKKIEIQKKEEIQRKVISHYPTFNEQEQIFLASIRNPHTPDSDIFNLAAAYHDPRFRIILAVNEAIHKRQREVTPLSQGSKKDEEKADTIIFRIQMQRSRKQSQCLF